MKAFSLWGQKKVFRWKVFGKLHDNKWLFDKWIPKYNFLVYFWVHGSVSESILYPIASETDLISVGTFFAVLPHHQCTQVIFFGYIINNWKPENFVKLMYF